MYISVLTKTVVHYVCNVHPLPQLWLCVVTSCNHFVYTSLYSKWKLTHWDSVSFYVKSISWSIFERLINWWGKTIWVIRQCIMDPRVLFINECSIYNVWVHMKKGFVTDNTKSSAKENYSSCLISNCFQTTTKVKTKLKCKTKKKSKYDAAFVMHF